MKITRTEALPFFAHPSQCKGFEAQDIPADDVAEYWARGPLCCVFVFGLWPRVWNVHIAAKPEGWGKLVSHGKAVLRAFCAAHDVDLITGWTPETNRAALAFARRVGFVEHGKMPTKEAVILQHWRP